MAWCHTPGKAAIALRSALEWQDPRSQFDNIDGFNLHFNKSG